MENGKKFDDELISLIRFLDKKNNKGDRIDYMVKVQPVEHGQDELG